MPSFDPLSATGLVRLGERGESYGGTCFAFRQPHIALTAAHCVPASAGEVWVEFPRLGDRRRAIEIIRHPEADVAIVLTRPDENDDGTGYPADAFWNCVSNWGLGEEFFAYGFPTEGPFQGADAPLPRVFVGHYQRFFRFETSTRGYLAGEMSIPAPAGLSGGPVFRPNAPQMVTGIVTSNLETYSVLHAVEEVDQSGQRYREESRRVIQYGLAAMLSDIEDWLDEWVPHRIGTPYNRAE